MQHKLDTLPASKGIALVAHDNRKADLLKWCIEHELELGNHRLFGTGTTGRVIEKETSLSINKLLSGPLGGDQQIGALISEGSVNMLIFFWDPFEPLPHDPDVKALLRIAAVWNVPVACNRSSADFMLSSSLINTEYQRTIPDYDSYLAGR